MLWQDVYLSWKSKMWCLGHRTVLSPALIMLLSHSSTSSACLQQKKIYSHLEPCADIIWLLFHIYISCSRFNQKLLMIAELTRSLHLLTASQQLTFVLCVNSDLHFESWIWPLEPAPYCMRFNNENQMLYWNKPCVTFGDLKQMWSEVEEKKKRKESLWWGTRHTQLIEGRAALWLTVCACVCGISPFSSVRNILGVLFVVPSCVLWIINGNDVQLQDTEANCLVWLCLLLESEIRYEI